MQGTRIRGHFRATVCKKCAEIQTDSKVQQPQIDFCAFMKGKWPNTSLCEKQSKLLQLRGRKVKLSVPMCRRVCVVFCRTGLSPPRGRCLQPGRQVMTPVSTCWVLVALCQQLPPSPFLAQSHARWSRMELHTHAITHPRAGKFS